MSQTEEDGAIVLKFRANVVNNEQFWAMRILETILGCDLGLWSNYH